MTIKRNRPILTTILSPEEFDRVVTYISLLITIDKRTAANRKTVKKAAAKKEKKKARKNCEPYLYSPLYYTSLERWY